MATNLVVKRKPGQVPTARYKLDAHGLDAVCDEITGGKSLTQISKDLGIHVSSLLEWVEADAQRLARTREARTRSARIWDERAEQVIAMAGDQFELSKAKELAHHYRWRAKAIAPKEYGDKVTNEHTGANGGAIQLAAVDLKGLSDVELQQMQTLLEKTGGA